MSMIAEPGRAAEETTEALIAELREDAEIATRCAGWVSDGSEPEARVDEHLSWRAARTIAQLQADLIAARKERDEAQDLADRRLRLMWRAPDRVMVEADQNEANLIALAKMYGEACRDLVYARSGEDDLFWQKEEAVVALSRKLVAAEEEAAQLRARLHEAEKGREGSGRDPGGSGSHASPEAPTDLRPEGFDPSRMQWQPIATVPIGEEVLLFGGRYALTKTRRGRQVGTIDDLDFMQRADGSFYPSAPTHWAPLIPEPPALGIEAAVPPEPKGPAEGESPAPTGAMPDPLTPAPEANQEAGDGR